MSAGRVRVTIEFLDRDDIPNQVMEADNGTSAEELGWERIPTLEGREDDYEPTGEYRFQIQGWTGCASFDAYNGLPRGES